MKAMDFVVRSVSGASRRGMVEDGVAVSVIEVSAGEEISLNIRQFQLGGYAKAGDDLQITLADGRIVTLKGYFDADGAAARLFISADGYLSEVTLIEGSDGALFAQYGPTEAWGKWSPHEDLIFMDGAEVTEPASPDDTVSMLAPGLFLGGGAMTAAGGLSALAAGSVLAGALGGNAATAEADPRAAKAGGNGSGIAVGGGEGGGSRGTEGGEAGPRLPTVNEKDPIRLGGGDTQQIIISGTGEPGAEVEVTIGNVSQVTTPDPDGNWQVIFEGNTMPADGTYPVVVEVTQPGGGAPITLPGPSVTIDTIPPVLAITAGTESAGHVVNGDDQRDGVDIAGTSEPGARIDVTLGTASRSVEAGADGRWSVNFGTADVPEGDYSRALTVTATDGFNNSTRVTDRVVVDTIPDPIVIQSGAVGGNGIVNFDEARSGYVVTGTSTPGNSLTLVRHDGTASISRTVDVGADGTWRVTYLPGEVRSGEYDVTLTATTSDAAGNIGRASGTFRVDTLHHLTIDPAPLGQGDVINRAAADGGVTLRGTTQPGSVVEVQFGTITRQVTSTDGTWSMRFAGSDFDRVGRDEYDASFNVTARDAAGNVNTAARAVRVDTVVDVAISGVIAGDGLINAADRDAGFTVNGTTDPGARVMVQLGNGLEKQANVDGFGNWSLRFNTADIPTGQDQLTLRATATDLAGNSNSASRGVALDTEVRDFAYTSTGVAADGIINGADAAAGLLVTGQVEPGSRVMVTLGSVTQEAQVQADGSWSTRFAPETIPGNEYVTQLRAVATDSAFNTETLTQTVRVDTRLNRLEVVGQVAGDGVINMAEARDGFAVTGRVEAADANGTLSTVRVQYDGQFYVATVDAAGNWRAEIPAGAVRTGTYPTEMIVHARDAAGNAGTLTQALLVDTDAPASPFIEGYIRSHQGIAAISIDTVPEPITLTEVRADGTLATVNSDETVMRARGETLHDFGNVLADGSFDATPLPNGSHLVVTATDQAGNTSGTFLAFDELSTSVIDLSAPLAAGMKIESIDLTFAEDSQLTLTEAQILALSPDTKTMTIHGDTDDQVTLTGAVLDGTETIGGRSYAVYDLGQARVFVDETVDRII
jgi:hypothetical protein